LESIGFLAGWAAAECEPATMGIGSMPAVQKLFRKTGLSLDDMNLAELKEAFACQVLACLKGWNWTDAERLTSTGPASPSVIPSMRPACGS